jgi:hypothetical protein
MCFFRVLIQVFFGLELLPADHADLKGERTLDH